MHMKKNILYIVLLLILGGLAFYIYQTRGSKSSISKSLNQFAVADTSAIDKIIISDKSGKVLTLTKKNKTWFASDSIRVRRDVIKSLLETTKRVTVKSPVNKAMKENVMKQLATGGVQVQIFTDGDLEKSYIVGSPTQDALGTYFLLNGADEPFIVHIPGFDGYLTVRYNPNLEVWRDREIFRYYPQQIDVVRIDYPGAPEKSFTLRVSGKDYIQLTNMLGDTAKGNINGDFLREYLTAFTDVQYENRADSKKLNFLELLVPENLIAIITVIDKEGKTRKVEMYKRYFDGEKIVASGKDYELDTDRMFAEINDKNVYNAQYRVFSKLIVNFEDFFSKPLNKLN